MSDTKAESGIRKIRNAGFTLIELLAAVAIIAVLVVIIGAGIPLAVDTMRESTFQSESTMLESTVDTSLSEALRYASDIHAGTQTGRWNFNTADARHNNVYLEEIEGYIVFVDSAGDTSVLVTKGAYINLLVTDFTYAYDSTSQIFSGSYTIVSSSDANMTRDVNFAYKAVWSGSVGDGT